MAPDIYFLSLHLLQLCLPGMLLLPCQQERSLSEGLFLGCRPCCACIKVTDMVPSLLFLLPILLLVLLIAQNLVRSQLTPAPAERCHRLHCVGEMCSKEAKFSSQMAECESGEHRCEALLSAGLQRRPLCLVLNDLALGLGHLIVPEDKLVPTPPAPQKNEKSCATFSCQGSECFKGQNAVAMCPEDLDFCEVFRAMVQSCCQECCHASASDSCLHLDGSLHFNRAVSGATRSPLHRPLAGAMLLLSALLP